MMVIRGFGVQLPVWRIIHPGCAIALLVLLCAPMVQAAPPRPLIRLIPVTGAQYQVLVDRPTNTIVVLGYAGAIGGAPILPAALTILNGTTGARLFSYHPTADIHTSAGAEAPVGGSGHVYFSIGHNLDTWTPAGTPRPVAVPLPVGPAVRVAVDERLGRFFAGQVGDTTV
ncbi:MAG TPA: hypothetical protein VHB98_12905, partial [Chloroflexota bacterium]|nr:hypothetical protein [Chloroflexota bacterium]